MDRPTRAEVKERSRLLRGRYPTDPSGSATDDLDIAIEDAAFLVASITGRKIGTAEGEEVPADLVSVAKRAVALKAEHLDTAAEEEAAEEAASGRRLRQISAGPWSESYFAPGELIVKGGVPQLDPDPRLAELLWALCTEEMREEYMALFTGKVAPAAAVTQFDYRRWPGGYR